MTTSEIAAEHGVSRQTVHAHRKGGAFPKPVEGEGSTRPRFRADEVAAFFAANPPSPGKRTDLAAARTEGESMLQKEQVAPIVVRLTDAHWEALGSDARARGWVEARQMGLTPEQSNRIADAALDGVRAQVEEWVRQQAEA
ncbi:helix-turn-helix transcriptional regulator [Streptomyces sp. BH105]|uniref:helix-turn-helix transcriptional regulator n=1 Tax=Streptomyces sp. BH105 TaxID=3410408 RepID=UPI003CFA76CA